MNMFCYYLISHTAETQSSLQLERTIYFHSCFLWYCNYYKLKSALAMTTTYPSSSTFNQFLFVNIHEWISTAVFGGYWLNNTLYDREWSNHCKGGGVFFSSLLSPSSSPSRQRGDIRTRDNCQSLAAVYCAARYFSQNFIPFFSGILD